MPCAGRRSARTAGMGADFCLCSFSDDLLVAQKVGRRITHQEKWLRRHFAFRKKLMTHDEQNQDQLQQIEGLHL